jgi:hypothetical protein
MIQHSLPNNGTHFSFLIANFLLLNWTPYSFHLLSLFYFVGTKSVLSLWWQSLPISPSPSSSFSRLLSSLACRMQKGSPILIWQLWIICCEVSTLGFWAIPKWDVFWAFFYASKHGSVIPSLAYFFVNVHLWTGHTGWEVVDSQSHISPAGLCEKHLYQLLPKSSQGPVASNPWNSS